MGQCSNRTAHSREPVTSELTLYLVPIIITYTGKPATIRRSYVCPFAKLSTSRGITSGFDDKYLVERLDATTGMTKVRRASCRCTNSVTC